MILFVFEGERREPRLFETLKRLFFSRDLNTIICSFGNNLYELYNQLSELGDAGDIVSLLRKKYEDSSNNPFQEVSVTSDISETYLFFDYDFHHHISLDEINSRVRKMLRLFNDETENGKLYISYPMIESIYYTKTLPDADYQKYIVEKEDCCDFKSRVREFSDYKDLGFILFHLSKKPTKNEYLTRRENWCYLVDMNVRKANWICTGVNSYPLHKADISQDNIFEKQLQKYVNTDRCCVAILNSFPLFIFDYFQNCLKD